MNSFNKKIKRIKRAFRKYHLNGLIKYFNYLLIILLSIYIVPCNSLVYANNLLIKEQDAYSHFEINNEFKKNYILDYYNLTNEQFRILCGIVLSEAKSKSYEDAYAVINVIYNRTHDKMWVKWISNSYGKDKGYSLYYQAIMPRQFVVYEKGSYLKNVGNIKSPGYQAILDFLFTEDTMHEYLSFRARYVHVKGSVQFVEGGNNYFNKMKAKNKI